MDPDTLANLVCVSQHLDRPPEIVKRFIRCDYYSGPIYYYLAQQLHKLFSCSQLKTKAPTHPMITALGTFEGAYDRISATLS
jgi:hypothetical protein